MGQREVIAEIDIDDAGVVRAIERTDTGMRQMQTGGQRAATTIRDQWSRTSTQFQSSGALMVRRMFDMRLAITSLLGAFTLAGLILKLVSLGAEVVRNTEIWKTWTNTINDAFRAALLGESRLDRLARRVGDLSKAAGLTTGLTISQQMKDLFEAQKLLRDELTRVPSPAISTTVRGRFGLPHTTTVPAQPLLDSAERKLIILELEKIREKMQALQVASGLTAAEFNKKYLTNFREELKGTQVDMVSMSFAHRNWIALQKEAKGVFEETFTMWDAERERLNDLTNKWELYGQAASAAIGAISAASDAGFVSQSAAAKVAALLVAAQAIQRGMMELALAAASVIPGPFFNPAAAALHKFAAGLFFATAAFQVAGAARGGGAVQATPSGRFGADAPINNGSARLNQTINLTVFGDPSDAQLRSITEGVAKALRDGVEGGSLALA